MDFGWKVLIPVALGWVFVVAAARVAISEDLISNTRALTVLAVPVAALLLISLILELRKSKTSEDVTEKNSSSFPVPPMSAARTKSVNRPEVEMKRGSDG
jgi:NADH-quinone oxidoreductase subunit H